MGQGSLILIFFILIRDKFFSSNQDTNQKKRNLSFTLANDQQDRVGPLPHFKKGCFMQ